MENLINYDYINEYFDKLISDDNGFLKELEDYAHENYIPIIFKEVKAFFRYLIPELKPKKILEIGTAIGYSAILIASLAPEATITTIEISEERFEEANYNIKKAGLSDRINIINDDAAEVIPYLKTNYDLIFIDAAKGQYSLYYKYCKELLSEGGTLIFDNILFKGLPANDELVSHKHRTIANNLKEFNKLVMDDPNLTSAILPLGDGLIISRKETKNEKA